MTFEIEYEIPFDPVFDTMIKLDASKGDEFIDDPVFPVTEEELYGYLGRTRSMPLRQGE